MSPEDLAEILKKELHKAGVDLSDQHRLLQKVLPHKVPLSPLDKIITSNEEMIKLKEKIKKVTPSSLSVLILGETGTGKELIANALHGDRKGRFIAVNCAGIPRELFESEFFGVKKGAFTGCIETREGYFEQAQNGTLFLDEIAEIPFDIQGKLLRVIENKCLRKVGSLIDVNINCRIVSATNNDDLHLLPRHFRQDLYYRLRGTELKTIPLKERRDDIRLIADYYDKDDKIPVEMITSWVNDTDRFPFKGNVRELKNLIEEYLCLYT